MSIQLTDNHQYNMKRIKNVKRCAAGGIMSAVSQAPDLISQGVGSVAGRSTAASESEAKSQTVSNVLGGAAKGASIGMAAGPIGAAVGAVVGAVPGLIGKKGKVTPNGFYEDPSVTYSTGLRSNKDIRRQYREAKQRVAGNRIAQGQGQDLESQFDETYDTDVISLAFGGYSPSLAYVDDGELIQTPDGEVSKVPENGQPTDSNLVSLPGGSKILSDKMKVPGTKKTFAQLGEEMMTKRKSKGKDRFAKNADKLNEMNNKRIHDQLFEQQESLKNKRGKVQSFDTTHFADGGVKSGYKNYNNYIYDKDTKKLPLDVNIENQDRQIDIMGREINPYFLSPSVSGRSYPTPTISSEAIAGTATRSASPTSTSPTTGSTDWSGVISSGLSSVASLAPVISNLTTGNAETVNTNYNPYANTIARTMRRRRFNINPAIEDLNRSRAISNYNAEQINPNTGANLAYRLQNAISTNRAIAGLRAQESAANNQYAGEFAETLNNLGQQYVGAINLSTDLNAQNRAATRNIRRAGLSQLSQWAQNRELMRNQRTRDDAMLDLYRPYLESGFSTSTLENVYNNYVKGGNRYGR